VVRPDQYVAHVLPLDAYAELAGFFARLMVLELGAGATTVEARRSEDWAG
jgi:hypothetical protein